MIRWWLGPAHEVWTLEGEATSVFVWRDFRKNGKFMRESEEEKLFKGHLVRKERRKKNSGAGCFLPLCIEKFSIQNKEKRKLTRFLGQKCSSLLLSP